MKWHPLWMPFFFLLFLSFLPIQVLVVEDEWMNKQVFTVHEGETFSIRWIHSVEEEEWEEFFVNKDGQIYLDSTRFKTFGAGVPHNAGKDAYLKNGWLYMVDIDRFIGDLHIRAGSTTNHRLFIHHQMYILSKPDHETAYHLIIKKDLLIKYLYQLMAQ